MGQRLLVLDTDSAFIDEHRPTLEFNFDADFIGSLDNAIKMLESGDYAAILISVEVAENRGYAVCASIRNRSSLAGFKIALISSKATKEDFARHSKLRVHADLYIFKPIGTDALISELKTVIPSKTSDLDNAIDALVRVDTGKERLDRSNSAESAKEDEPLPIPPVIDKLIESIKLIDAPENNIRDPKIEPQAKTTRLMEAQQENQEPQSQNNTIAISLGVEESEALQKSVSNPRCSLPETEERSVCLLSSNDLEAKVRELEAELQAKTAALLEAQQENQELQRQNTSITVNLEELEAHQKKAEELQRRLQETEEQLKYLELGASEDSANGSLRNHLKEAIVEKQALLRQLETLTQEIAAKNLQAVAFLKSKEDLLQHLLNVEESKHRLELEFETRVESERKLFMSRLDDHQDSAPALRKRISELEDVCAAKNKELESAHSAHSEEIRRLTTDFESQRQHMTFLSNTRQKAILTALSALDEARGALAKLPVGSLAAEDGS